MKPRRTDGQYVLGICALFGVLLLAGCVSSRKEADHEWASIPRSADAVVSTNSDTVRRASPPAISQQRLNLSERVPQSSFSDYDRAVIDSVEQRWNDLLDKGAFPLKNGLVVVEFTLSFNGTVSNVAVAKSTVNKQLSFVCTRAILDAAPFPPWPAPMRRQIGDKRVIKFTFNYLK